MILLRLGRPARRWWFVVPLACIAMTLTFNWIIAEPLHRAHHGSTIGSWLAGSLALCAPYLMASALILVARRSALARTATLGYLVAAGVLGLLMSIWVLSSEHSTAPIGLVIMLVLQVFVLGPLGLLVAVLVWAVRRGLQTVEVDDQSGRPGS